MTTETNTAHSVRSRLDQSPKEENFTGSSSQKIKEFNRVLEKSSNNISPSLKWSSFFFLIPVMSDMNSHKWFSHCHSKLDRGRMSISHAKIVSVQNSEQYRIQIDTNVLSTYGTNFGLDEDVFHPLRQMKNLNKTQTTPWR